MSTLEVVTAMHHEPVADRLGVRTHPLPADWRTRGGAGGGGRGGRGWRIRWPGCGWTLLLLLAGVILGRIAARAIGIWP